VPELTYPLEDLGDSPLSVENVNHSRVYFYSLIHRVESF
jgi:hypothetical protein